MINLTGRELIQIAPHTPNPDVIASNLLQAMTYYNIITPRMISCFLGQAALESNEFRQTLEDGDGIRYEGRKDLGNINPGDGPLYRGRGFFQLTGRANYEAASKALGIDLVGYPHLVEQYDIASFTACWFWQVHQLSPLAEQLDIQGITRRINGGYNNLKERIAYTQRALKTFGG